jgi:hypothetical protein
MHFIQIQTDQMLIVSDERLRRQREIYEENFENFEKHGIYSVVITMHVSYKTVDNNSS